MADDPSWEDLRVLLAVYREGSFLGAGNVLDMAGSTVARRIDALEQRIGCQLVHRSNAGVSLEPDALPLIDLARSVELGLRAFRRDVGAAKLTGTVRVSVSEGFARPIARVLASLRSEHPALQLELAVDARLADLARLEADVAIRIAPGGVSTSIERTIGMAPLGLFAAEPYVAARVRGRHLARASAHEHDWVGFDDTLEPRVGPQSWLRSYGATRFSFRSTSSAAQEEAIIAGAGVGMLVVARGLQLGLVQLTLDEAPPEVPVILAYHRDAQAKPRVQAVVRALEAELRRHL